MQFFGLFFDAKYTECRVCITKVGIFSLTKAQGAQRCENYRDITWCPLCLCAKQNNHTKKHTTHLTIICYRNSPNLDATVSEFREIARKNSKMKLTRTQVVLLKLALKALPVATTMGGALFGYLAGHDIGRTLAATIHGVTAEPSVDAIPWRIVWENAAIGIALGLTGGVALSCFGLIFSDFITVTDDPDSRYTGSTGGGVEGSAGNKAYNKTYYKKYDVGDHERSTQKVTAKYDDQKQKAEAEIQEMLEIGTEGIRERKLGKRVDNKTSTPTTPEP